MKATGNAGLFKFTKKFLKWIQFWFSPHPCHAFLMIYHRYTCVKISERHFSEITGVIFFVVERYKHSTNFNCTSWSVTRVCLIFSPLPRTAWTKLRDRWPVGGRDPNQNIKAQKATKADPSVLRDWKDFSHSVIGHDCGQHMESFRFISLHCHSEFTAFHCFLNIFLRWEMSTLSAAAARHTLA